MRRAPTAGTDEATGAGMAAGRGAILLAVAVILGIVLLNAADDAPAGQPVVVIEDDPQSTVVLDDDTTTSAPLRLPAEVRVIAANGTRTKGAAARIAETLKAAGYTVLESVDAPKADASVVYFVSGYEREAMQVASTIGLAETAVQSMPIPPPVSEASGANVLIIVGPDLASGRAATTAPTSGTTTTTR